MTGRLNFLSRQAVLAAAALVVAAPAPAQDAAAAASAKLALCAACHGADGNSTTARYPILGGQPQMYTYLRLKQLRRQVNNAEMTPIAQSLSEEEIGFFASHFEGKKPAPGLARFDAARAERGAKVAAQLNCAQCHGADYAGGNQMPRLAGQHPEYLVAQMQLILQNVRSDDNGNMVDALKRVQSSDIEDMAHYFASVK